MDFEFSAEEKAFAAEVERFLDEHATPDVADVTRENMAQIVDTPARRAFMKKLAQRGWLGMTWPKAVRRPGKAGRLRVHPERGPRAARLPADRQGRRHHRQDADPPRLGEAEARVPAADHPRRDRVRGRLQRATGRLRRRQHAAPRRARRRAAGASTVRRSGPPPHTSPTGTGWARAPTRRRRSTTASRSS